MNRTMNPLRELEALRRGIDQVFAGVWPSYDRRGSMFLPGRSARNYPRVNLWGDSEKFTVEAFAPGLDLDTLDVTVQGNLLTIAGEKKPLTDVPAEAFHRNERSVGKFMRTYELDSDIDESTVEADYTNGILKIVLPKSEAAKPKKIAVSAG